MVFQICSELHSLSFYLHAINILVCIVSFDQYRFQFLRLLNVDELVVGFFRILLQAEFSLKASMDFLVNCEVRANFVLSLSWLQHWLDSVQILSQVPSLAVAIFGVLHRAISILLLLGELNPLRDICVFKVRVSLLKGVVVMMIIRVAVLL